MAYNLDDSQSVSKAQLEAVTTLSSSFVKSLQAIAAETTDYSKKSFEDGAAFLERLRGAQSFESAVEVQSEYAKAAYSAFIEQAKKIGEFYSNLSKEAFKPVETAIAKVQGGK